MKCKGRDGVCIRHFPLLFACFCWCAWLRSSAGLAWGDHGDIFMIKSIPERQSLDPSWRGWLICACSVRGVCLFCLQVHLQCFTLFHFTPQFVLEELILNRDFFPTPICRIDVLLSFLCFCLHRLLERCQLLVEFAGIFCLVRPDDSNLSLMGHDSRPGDLELSCQLSSLSTQFSYL